MIRKFPVLGLRQKVQLFHISIIHHQSILDPHMKRLKKCVRSISVRLLKWCSESLSCSLKVSSNTYLMKLEEGIWISSVVFQPLVLDIVIQELHQRLRSSSVKSNIVIKSIIMINIVYSPKNLLRNYQKVLTASSSRPVVLKQILYLLNSPEHTQEIIMYLL